MIKQNFKCSLSTAVFTTRGVLNQGKPITIVLHEMDDGNWKFLSKEDLNVTRESLIMVSLQDILMIDPTLSEIAFLKEGNIAIRRFVGDDWKSNPISYQASPGNIPKIEVNP
jgi:hypothetical protein